MKHKNSIRIAGDIDTVPPNETCGCAECCETCWADCCATDDDIEALQHWREDLEHQWSVCSWWAGIYGPDAVLVSPRGVVLRTQ